MVEADLELYRTTKEEYLLERAKKNVDAFYERWKAKPPDDMISNAAIAACAVADVRDGDGRRAGVLATCGESPRVATRGQPLFAPIPLTEPVVGFLNSRLGFFHIATFTPHRAGIPHRSPPLSQEPPPKGAQRGTPLNSEWSHNLKRGTDTFLLAIIGRRAEDLLPTDSPPDRGT